MPINRRAARAARRRLAGFGVLVLLSFATLPLLLGQLQTSPTFEVTSVKPNNLPPRERKIERLCSGGRFSSRGGAVVAEIKWAYQIETFDPLGVPAWAGFSGDRYDIEARASASMTEDQCRLMVQTLLADRFKLKVRWEAQETPVYALVTAKSGPKMQKVTESDPPNSVRFTQSGTPMQMFAPELKGWTMDQLAQALSVAGLERTVVNRTGLEGVYKFDLEFRHESLPVGRGTDVRTAVQKLGLKLEARKEKVKKLVVDHIEKPDAN